MITGDLTDLELTIFIPAKIERGTLFPQKYA
jgi:hypothetical protein